MNRPELRDIHLPGESLWWPPAPGWWLLAILVAVIILLLPRLRRWLRHRPLRRMSMRELERIRLDYKEGQGEKAAVNAIAALLRRITISYYGRSGQAASTGDEWRRQLQRLAPGAGFSDEQLELLIRGRYRAEAEVDVESLASACERWLRALPRSETRVTA